MLVRLLNTFRSTRNYQQPIVRLLSIAEPAKKEINPTMREKGIVKRFSREKGFGFICNATDGVDYFVHFKNINATGFKTLEEGQEVEFTASKSDKGLEAKDVVVANTTTTRPSFLKRQFADDESSAKSNFGSFSKPRSSSSSFDFGGDESYKSTSTRGESTSTDRTFRFNENSAKSFRDNLFSNKTSQTAYEQTREIGSVKGWKADRGFGFIRRTNSTKDLFCHVRSLKDGLQTLEQGQTVEFIVHQTPKGEEARDVTIVNDGGLKQQKEEDLSTVNLGERQSGTVKKWIGARGYGFLIPDNGGADLFVHIRNLSNGIEALEEGQKVEFNLGKSEKGEAAYNVNIVKESNNDSTTPSET